MTSFPAADTPPCAAPAPDKPLILVVDDQAGSIALLYEIFRDDYEVCMATSGEQALNFCVHSLPHLILLDVCMPGIDGFETCRLLKRSERTSDIPIIFVTAHNDPLEEEHGLNAGGADFIAKPFHASVVSARVRTQLTLKSQADALRRMAHTGKAAAEKASLAKSEFLSMMSHELRSPLNAVLGFAQLMGTETPAPSARQRNSIDRIQKAGWHLLGLIDEILDLAVIEAGNVTLALETVPLNLAIQQCLKQMAPLARTHSVMLEFPDSDCAYSVRVDRQRFEQIILSLLSNAILYNRVGGAATVTCRVTRRGRVRINIADTGVGLSPEQLHQLFQAFNRLGQEKKLERSIGIGLFVCKQLVNLMDGMIGADSQPGVGSDFWIEFVASSGVTPDEPEPYI